MRRNLHVGLVVYGEKSGKRIAEVLSSLKVKFTPIYSNDKGCLVARTSNFTHIILSGGPQHAYDPENCKLPDWVINSDAPVLGICYGMQLIAESLGGKVYKLPEKQYGIVPIVTLVEENHSLVQKIDDVWMNRYDGVMEVPNSFVVTSVTQENQIAAFTDGEKWWGVQYHPESTKALHTSVFESFLDI